VQRWFSSFPDRWPGIGLLLLRLTLAASLFADASARLRAPASPLALPAVADILLGTALIAGIWTPLVAIGIALLQIGMAAMAEGPLEPPLQRAAAALCLALVGPGAWSIDARLFGRRRVEIKNLGDS
jgi:putative oxidoreductase